MKALAKIVQTPIVLLILTILFTSTSGGLLGFFFVLPQFKILGESQQKTEDLRTRLAKLTTNVDSVKSLDTAQIGSYLATIGSFLPDKNDYLHFAQLNDQLANEAGLRVTSFTISAALKTSPAAPAANASGSIGGAGSSGTSTPAAPKPPVVAAASGYNVVVSYSGSYEGLLNFLKNLHNLDRAVGVSRILITATSGGSELTISTTFFLPLAKLGLGTVSSENIILLTSSDSDFLNNLQSQIQFNAVPANSALGKANPFN